MLGINNTSFSTHSPNCHKISNKPSFIDLQFTSKSITFDLK